MLFGNKKLLLMLSMAFYMCGLVACSDYDNWRRKSVSGESILSSNGTPLSKAEQLTDAAEELLAAQAFDEAYKMINEALKQDASYLRARFIGTMLELLVLQKGILNRVTPLLGSNTRLKQNFETINADSRNEVLLKYFKDGPADILTEKSLQMHFDKTIVILNKIRTFLKQYRNEELKVRATTLMVVDTHKRYAYACEIKLTSDELSYELSCPPDEILTHVSLNRADFEVLISKVSGTMFELVLYNAYDISEFFKKEALFDKTLPGSHQKFADDLQTNENFGRLRATHKLALIKNLGLSFVLSFRWFLENKKTICRLGTESPKNRVGMLKNEGVCLYDEYRPYLDAFEQILLSKKTPKIRTVKDDVKYETSIALMPFLSNPPKDLKKLGPLKIDDCGQATELRDQTVGGLFPLGDFNKFQEMRNKECPR